MAYGGPLIPLAALLVCASCGDGPGAGEHARAGDAEARPREAAATGAADATTPARDVDPKEAARRTALLRLQNEALERQSLAAHELVALSVGLCGMDYGALPGGFAQAVQTVTFVPFVGRLGPPHTDRLRSGHWYDADRRVVFADVDLAASIAELNVTERAGVHALALGLVFADAAPAALAETERFAAAGAFVRTFIAGERAPAVLDAERASRALAGLEERLASLVDRVGEPASGETASGETAERPMALPNAPGARAAAIDAYRRGYSDPGLGFVPALGPR